MATKSKAKRIQLNLLVSPEMKERIAGRARASGRSQGQVAEGLMLKQFAYEELVAAMGRRLEEIEKGNVEAALLRRGLISKPRTGADGKVRGAWFERGHPDAPPPSGVVVPWNEGERPPYDVTIRGYEDGSVEAISTGGSGEESKI